MKFTTYQDMEKAIEEIITIMEMNQEWARETERGQEERFAYEAVKALREAEENIDNFFKW